MPGTIVTFYSYKGGVGRTFAVANIGLILSQWGYRVLMIDWDIEAPGLIHYFSRFVTHDTRGVLDLITDAMRGQVRHPQYYLSGIPDLSGSLYIMPSGKLTSNYITVVQSIDWNALYDRHDFGRILEDFRDDWKRSFDIILIDSRTGITDFTGILTVQLPDIVAFLFTASNQSLNGVIELINRAIDARRDLMVGRAAFFALPIPSRFEMREEYKQAQEWRKLFASRTAPYIEVWAAKDVGVQRIIDYTTIPYFPYWSFGEELAVLEERPDESSGIRAPGVITYSLETIAAVIANRLGLTEILVKSRDTYVRTAKLAALQDAFDVFISGGDREKYYARELANTLRRRDVSVTSGEVDLSAGQSWRQKLADQLSRSRNLVVLVGPQPSDVQIEEAKEFILQSVHRDENKRVIPVLLPNASVADVPAVLKNYHYLEMGNDDIDSLVDRLKTRLIS